MTNVELISKIKAEIERRIKECEATYPKDKDGYWFPEQEDAYAIAEEYKQLLSILGTLEERVPEIKKTGTQGLDEAAKNYALNTAEDSEQYSARYLGYKDGAKWQKEQDDKELSEKIASAYQLGLADKEKMMMKEAVEADVMLTLHDKTGDISLHTGYLPKELGIKCDDKVKIIIVKE